MFEGRRGQRIDDAGKVESREEETESESSVNGVSYM